MKIRLIEKKMSFCLLCKPLYQNPVDFILHYPLLDSKHLLSMLEYA